MNEVKLLNIGGIDQNIKDQYARDVIAPSENGLDSSTNLPVSSRHYDVGAYLIGQDRQYYEVIDEIDIGDTIVVGTNVRATTVSDEIITLKNQSADTVIEVIADKEDGALATQSYTVGKYIYWAYGLTAGLYIVTAAISSGDALVSGEGGNIAPANKVCDDIKELKENISLIINNITNPNLIDNPWFTINQRGKSVYTPNSGDYTFDRWKVYKAGSTVTVVDNGISFQSVTDYSNLTQYLEVERTKLLLGKTYTLSAIVDGNLYSHTFTLPDAFPASNVAFTKYILNNACEFTFLLESNGRSQVWFRNNYSPGTHIIRAIKLELGVLSTLNLDTAPNHQQELAKCQRYFERSYWKDVGCGRCVQTGKLELGMEYEFITPKRTIPVFRFNQTGTTGLNNGYVYDPSNDSYISASTVTLSQPGAYNINMVRPILNNSNFVKGKEYYVALGDYIIDISADL